VTPALVVALGLLDARARASYARERWSWVPVYGLYVTLREERVRERLLAERVDLETSRILALEKR
jgi:hypothetical protein